VLVAIPIIHCGKHGLGLVHGEYRTFGKHVEVFVGYDRRYLDDQVRIGLEARHFQIDPNEIFGGFHGV
jgi:hypothetical protein